MTAFTITVQDQAVRAVLKALSQRTQNLQPVLRTIGQGIIERTKRRFETSTAPDGTPWKPNSAATLAMLSARLSGKSGYVKKNGALNKKGLAAYGNKKPLIGESQDLRRQFVSLAAGNTLTITSTPKYAAIQQFGGKAGRGQKVTIPARPFLPIKPDGTLYPQEQYEVLTALNAYLMDGLGS